MSESIPPSRASTPPPSYATEAPQTAPPSPTSTHSSLTLESDNESESSFGSGITLTNTPAVPFTAAPAPSSGASQSSGVSRSSATTTVIGGYVESDAPDSPFTLLLSRHVPSDLGDHNEYYAISFGRGGIACVTMEWAPAAALVLGVSKAVHKKKKTLPAAFAEINNYRAANNLPPLENIPVIPSGAVLRFPTPSTSSSTEISTDTLQESLLAAVQRAEERRAAELREAQNEDNMSALESRFSNLGSEEMAKRLSEIDKFTGKPDDNFRARPRASTTSTAGPSRLANTTSASTSARTQPLPPRYQSQAHGVHVSSSSAVSRAHVTDSRMYRRVAQIYLAQVDPAIILLHETRDHSNRELRGSHEYEERAQAARRAGEPLELVLALEEEAMLRLQSASLLAQDADSLYQRVSLLLEQHDRQSALAETLRPLRMMSRTHGEVMERAWVDGFEDEGEYEDVDVDEDEDQPASDPKGKGKAT